ncbi:5-dehydro-4-deoxy-D-glucuronate isomerase [Consotaella salsifontis]|uniref:4-deoxy-L-threo-5-hexosulose-uronate ketol-isomerase n=1 Tax=Consotaella salsifontis TaxID=1365950 RepID=A0A1T4RLG2_9HYPH|nr:5-dehydro-4-deoxy-D-glucuronate isomerase [Consotaella salsifontis]SKA16598.1 4-deoxy-L-threo-5-hexosulose-uronate ketol-isomerase [Consotaella salsifontis]
MNIRYSVNQRDFKRYTTDEVRDEFLIQNLYVADTVVAVYSHVDRMVVFGIMPVSEAVPLDKGIECMKSFGTDYILERRELGLFNLGGAGTVEVDGQTFDVGFQDCVYISKGSRNVVFKSKAGDKPAKFYCISAPAHKVLKTTFLSMADAKKVPMGDDKSANKRVINQFIHPDVLETCQLCMGLTQLEPGNVWNTMPAHTHERRSEIYTYFNVPEDQAVFHMMGEGQETRHILVHNEDAVISPSWSIHAGCGTTAYTFIWAMGGENQVFPDMDHIAIKDLR